jgi:hypothetical protein
MFRYGDGENGIKSCGGALSCLLRVARWPVSNYIWTGTVAIYTYCPSK